ncbi:UNVERIFIED_ORG: putative membrane protein [Rhizobium etli]
MNPKSTLSIAGHPIHPMLIPFPVAFFAGTLVTDIVHSQSDNPFWPAASNWMLAAGLVMAALAALAGLTDFLGDARIRALRDAWLHMIGNVVVVLIEAVSLWRRLVQGPDFIVPTGMVLSLLAVALLLFNGWKGWEMVYRHRVGVKEETDIR